LRLSKDWDGSKGPTALFEMGMNPGIISHCVNRGLEDAARHYIKDESSPDIDKF
jgi:homospermidine synthase